MIAKTLREPPHCLRTVVLSIDDFYLKHADQVALASKHKSNPLVQHRGQPSTHDIPLGILVFDAFKANRQVKLPQYDKSRFNGQGDRVDESQWEEVNSEGQESIAVVLFEGWCVGFEMLPLETLREKWKDAVEKAQLRDETYQGQLGWHELRDVCFVNEALCIYSELTW